jgi:p-cumate 2,3-dioxygenase beta subunit
MSLRAEVETFLFYEAELLDAWKLDDWFALFVEGGCYFVPPTDKPEASHHDALFIIADDYTRLRERILRLKDPNCHAEYPPSRTRRLITNLRANEVGGVVGARANFALYRHRRDADARIFTGEYRYALERREGALRIRERRAVLDAHELGQMGAVSFIL